MSSKKKKKSCRGKAMTVGGRKGETGSTRRGKLGKETRISPLLELLLSKGRSIPRKKEALRFPKTSTNVGAISYTGSARLMPKVWFRGCFSGGE